MAGKNNGKATDADAIDAAKKRAKALELRLTGATFQQIADAVGYAGRQGAHAAVVEAIHETYREKAEELRNVQMERYNLLLFGHFQNAINGDKGAAKVVLDTLAAINKLHGLDAPIKVAPTTPDGKNEWRLVAESLSPEAREAIERAVRAQFGSLDPRNRLPVPSEN